MESEKGGFRKRQRHLHVQLTVVNYSNRISDRVFKCFSLDGEIAAMTILKTGKCLTVSSLIKDRNTLHVSLP